MWLVELKRDKSVNYTPYFKDSIPKRECKIPSYTGYMLEIIIFWIYWVT